MLVREALPSRQPVTLVADDEIAHAARVLLHHGFSSAPVLGTDGGLVGVVSESDLLRGRVRPDPRSHLLPHDDLDDTGEELFRTVAEVMTPHPVTVDLRDDLADAVAVLLDRGFKAVPVMDGHRLVGVLARRDVLRTLTHDDEDVRRAVQDRLAEDLPDQTWTVTADNGVVTVSGPYDAASQRVAAVVARTVPGVVRVAVTADPLSYDDPDATRRDGLTRGNARW
ncbi:CBS domain-containing protein [Kineococcus sp. SYSU DK003]|uniref:CBS domain-containing protein n=1 Tax=Kineococcus sp. SYSU DK003 TaxID=3383124 RepID=UPI003D7DC44F